MATVIGPGQPPKPVYDLEYADDALLLSVTLPQMEEFLRTVQVEASFYGMELNLDKTELLEGSEVTPPIYFVDGTAPTFEKMYGY